MIWGMSRRGVQEGIVSPIPDNSTINRRFAGHREPAGFLRVFACGFAGRNKVIDHVPPEGTYSEVSANGKYTFHGHHNGRMIYVPYEESRDGDITAWVNEGDRLNKIWTGYDLYEHTHQEGSASAGHIRFRLISS